jgi:hypothetical protein
VDPDIEHSHEVAIKIVETLQQLSYLFSDNNNINATLREKSYIKLRDVKKCLTVLEDNFSLKGYDSKLNSFWSRFCPGGIRVCGQTGTSGHQIVHLLSNCTFASISITRLMNSKLVDYNIINELRILTIIDPQKITRDDYPDLKEALSFLNFAELTDLQGTINYEMYSAIQYAQNVKKLADFLPHGPNPVPTSQQKDESSNTLACNENPKANKGLSKEALAIATLFNYPYWTDALIARAVGCHRTSLYRFPNYMAARKLIASNKHGLPKGFKTKDGKIEAMDQTEDED